MPTPSRSILAVALAATAAAFSTAACSRAQFDRAASTLTYSATAPPADRSYRQSRTIDNAGFVDNGGRTSDETSRTEMSGMRATETGSERPTGTVTGLPLPEPSPTQATAGEGAAGEGAGAASSVRGYVGPEPTGGPPSEAIGRLARARCDRETACDRVGSERPWGSQEACVSEHRERARAEVASLDCRRGVDGTQLATCLSSIRLQACEPGPSELDVVAECQTSALCVP